MPGRRISHRETDSVVHHIVNGMDGTIFDGAYIDGIHPENLSIGTQTLNPAASQGVAAEFTASAEGRYPFVRHDFTIVAKGLGRSLRTRARKARWRLVRVVRGVWAVPPARCASPGPMAR
jgi:hypothetical protein